jgi:hypothetical protein
MPIRLALSRIWAVWLAYDPSYGYMTKRKAGRAVAAAAPVSAGSQRVGGGMRRPRPILSPLATQGFQALTVLSETPK